MLPSKWLIRTYIGLTIVTAFVFAAPIFALVLALPTAGLSFLAPTLWLYATVALAILALRGLGSSTAIVGIAASLAVLALAFGPSIAARLIAERIQRERTAGDFEHAMPSRPRSLEIVTKSKSLHPENNDPLAHAVCDAVCQRLLLFKQADAVTVKALRAKDLSPVFVTYELKQQATCPVAFAEGRSALPMTVKANIDGSCIVPDPGREMKDGVSIHEEILDSHFVPKLSLVEVRYVKRLKIVARNGGTESRLLQRTEVDLRIAAWPFRLHSFIGFLGGGTGWATSKSDLDFNRYVLADFISDRLGYALPSGNDSANADAGFVTKILDKPGTEPFGEEVSLAIDNWLARSGYADGRRKPDSQTLDLFAKILLDRRLYPAHGMVNVFMSNRELTPIFADQILSRLSWPEPARRYTTNSGLAFFISSHLNDDQLGRLAPRILDIVRQPTANTSPLFAALTHLGRREVLPFLQDALESDDRSIVSNAIFAACRAHPSLAQDLIPMIEKMLADPKHTDRVGGLIRVLAVLKGPEAAKAAIARRPDWQRKQLTLMLTALLTAGSNIDCLS